MIKQKVDGLQIREQCRFRQIEHKKGKVFHAVQKDMHSREKRIQTFNREMKYQ